MDYYNVGIKFGGNQDIDELIRNIDKQIAAIEEEERREKEKNSGTQENVEKEPTAIADNTDTSEDAEIDEKDAEFEENNAENDIEYRPIEKTNENEPTVSEIIPSKDIDFDTFEVKEKEEKKETKDESDYDDFFDDFFDE